MSISREVYIDGVLYSSIKEATLHTGYSSTYIRKCLDSGVEITGKSVGRTYNRRQVTINNKVYASMVDAAKDFGMTPIQLSKRIRKMREQGYDENNLDLIGYMQSHKSRNKGHKGRNDITAFNVHYETSTLACRAFNISTDRLSYRLYKRWDVEVALCKPTDIHEQLTIEFIGLDGKAYYKVTWANKYVTARQIVEYYRPDLVEAYDKSNPTGEYRPYNRGEDNNE